MMEICSLKTSQTMINLSGSCPNIHASTEEETLCPLPQVKENLAALKKNSWKWLSLPHPARSPLGGRRFSWNSSSKTRSKRSPVKTSAQTSSNEQHPLLTASRARGRAYSTTAITVDEVDVGNITCSSVEDSFAEIKHQLATLSQQDRYFTQRLHDLDRAIQDVRLIAFGKYPNENNCPNSLQSRRGSNIPKRACEHRLPHHKIIDLDPKMTSHSETCIIVISDTEATEDDDVFSS